MTACSGAAPQQWHWLPVVFMLLLAGWAEPPRSLPAVSFTCARPVAIDGDTMRCVDGRRVRLRGVDTPERGEPRYREARDELQRRLDAGRVTVIPHHNSRDRIVGDVMVRGRNVGQAMDQAGWSKPVGARR